MIFRDSDNCCPCNTTHHIRDMMKIQSGYLLLVSIVYYKIVQYVLCIGLFSSFVYFVTPSNGLYIKS